MKNFIAALATVAFLSACGGPAEGQDGNIASDQSNLGTAVKPSPASPTSTSASPGSVTSPTSPTKPSNPSAPPSPNSTDAASNPGTPPAKCFSQEVDFGNFCATGQDIQDGMIKMMTECKTQGATPTSRSFTGSNSCVTAIQLECCF